MIKKSRLLLMLVVGIVFVLGLSGCVSYKECRTQEERVRARYEQYFIMPNDSSSTIFWKNTKHVFLDFVTCCFHEMWRGNAKRTYWRMIQSERSKDDERKKKESNEVKQAEKTQNANNGSEVKEKQPDQALVANPTLTPQLGDAIGMTAEWDKRNKAAEENIKKRYFKNDEEGFNRWNTRIEKVKHDIETRANILRYEESQTRQYMKTQHVLNEQAEDTRAKENHITANNALLSEYAEERDTTQRDYDAEWDVENKKWLSRKEWSDKTFVANHEMNEDQAKAFKQQYLEEEGLKSKEAFLAIQKKKEDRLAAAKKKYDDAMAINAAKLNEHYDAALKRRMAFFIKSGYDSKMAFTAAASSVGKDAKAMLVGLIDAGQGAYVQTILNELSKPNKSTVKIKRIDPHGKPVLGKDGKEVFDYEYDPRLRMCMDTTQIAEVQDYLDIRKAKEETKRKVVERREEKPQNVKDEVEGPGAGTGWFVNQKCVVTCWHVVKGAVKIKVLAPNGYQTMANIVAKNEESDIAILKVEDFQQDSLSLPIRVQGVKLADKVFTIGYPLSDLLGKEQRYSEGSVSAMSGIIGDEHYLQISTPLQPGNSGGPLVDENGNVIGIVSGALNAITATKITGAIPQNVNYAIKVRYLIEILDGAGIEWHSQNARSALIKESPVEKVMKATCLITAE